MASADQVEDDAPIDVADGFAGGDLFGVESSRGHVLYQHRMAENAICSGHVESMGLCSNGRDRAFRTKYRSGDPTESVITTCDDRRCFYGRVSRSNRFAGSAAATHLSG